MNKYVCVCAFTIEYTYLLCMLHAESRAYIVNISIGSVGY